MTALLSWLLSFFAPPDAEERVARRWWRLTARLRDEYPEAWAYYVADDVRGMRSPKDDLDAMITDLINEACGEGE